jgi:endonuclease/exonuclease/phosphatase family metal-dependent hydrolase
MVKKNIDTDHTLNLLSYNIQAASQTSSYREYVTKGWKQLLPNRHQLHNLNAIGEMLGSYDFVGLQEVDAGSFRSGFINQTRYLAGKAGFPYWFTQPNRNMGHIAKHSNGLLSRFEPSSCRHCKLPGMPGRGILVAEYSQGYETLAVIVVHLALGGRSQRRQFDFILKLSEQYPHVIILGDFNIEPDSKEMIGLLSSRGLQDSSEALTFPSWKPRRKIDYILVSESMQVCTSEVVDYHLSDHLPIELKVFLPESVQLEG